MKNKKIFIVIDALAIAYKSYFAHLKNPLSNSKGESTSAIFGFANSLFKVFEEYKPDFLAVAFDSKEKTFRHEKYDFYKSSRAEMPEELIPQIQKIKEFVELLNVPILIQSGYEADDLVGSILKIAEKQDFACFAVTPDKDYIQLINETTKIIRPGKGGDEWQLLDCESVKNDYGFQPIMMIDYLGLVGDSSDDIPGVAGIGPKSATELIQTYGGIDEIYQNIENIKKEAIKSKLENGREKAFLSKELATIVTDIPINIDFENENWRNLDFEKLSSFLVQLELKSIHNKAVKLFGENQTEAKKEIPNIPHFVNKNYKLITTKNESKKLVEYLSEFEFLTFDTETDGLDLFSSKLVGVSFCVKSSEAYFVAINPTQNSTDLFSKQIDNRLPFEDFDEIFSPLFANKRIKKIAQNGKFDIAILRSRGITVENFYFDTMLASYLIDADQKHGMDELSQKYLNYKPIPFSDLVGDKKDSSKIFDVEIEKLTEYAAEDADVTFRLYEIFKDILDKENLAELAFKVEFPLAIVLENMERNGVKVDKKMLEDFSIQLQKRLDLLTTEIYQIAEVNFNINSPKQLQKILFEKLKLPTTLKTKTGFSTDAKNLEALQGKHPIIDFLLEYRQIAKLKSTYAEALPKLINPKTGKIHTTYNQTIASTGRLSSVNPNLQNIPIRTELGQEIRKAFIPSDENHVIISADYSQIELRIMASICEDPFLTKAFSENADIHKRTAALVFQIEEEQVTSDMRRKAKEVNFGILYGLGAFGLKSRLGITQTHAKEIIDTYFSTFPNVKKFMSDSIDFARKNGFAQTLLLRKRFLRNINSKNGAVRQFEERVAINMPIQGTAADLIKIAMINIHQEFIANNLISKMVLQVHDELVFDVYKPEIEIVKKIITEKMESAIVLNVPLRVEVGIGKNWLEAH